MGRLPFVAARDSRHRKAALALYRALLRSASKIPLAENVSVTKRPASVADVVRRRFDKNRPYTSFRLIYAAMAAGYKFLTLFTKAQMAGSPEHTQIVAHLRSNPLPSSKVSRAAAKSHNRKYKEPRAYKEPLLKNEAQPGEPSRYIPTACYISTGRIPSLCSTADGQPFLRIRKPQPRALSKMVGRKGRIFTKKIQKLVEVDEELSHDAALEDQWDSLVDKQMRRESRDTAMLENASAGGRSPSSLTSFSWSVQLSRLWWEWQIEKTWQDWVARGEALNRLVEKERDSLAKETSSQSGHKQIKDSKMKQRSSPASSQPAIRPNVAVHPAPPLPLSSALQAQLGRQSFAKQHVIDPFMSPAWTSLVQSEQPRLLKWIAKGPLSRSQS